MLKETYLGNVQNLPVESIVIEVTRSKKHVLSPSRALLNDYKNGKIDWKGYISRFLQEMDNPECKAELLRIGELAEARDVYLVCYERAGNCRSFLLVDMIKRAMVIEACRKKNQGKV